MAGMENESRELDEGRLDELADLMLKWHGQGADKDDILAHLLSAASIQVLSELDPDGEDDLLNDLFGLCMRRLNAARERLDDEENGRPAGRGARQLAERYRREFHEMMEDHGRQFCEEHKLSGAEWAEVRKLVLGRRALDRN
jgi:hypothetical protein